MFWPSVLTLAVSVLMNVSNTIALTVFAPASVPSDASSTVSHSFQSWACAVHSWPDYAGNHTSPNVFSRTLLGIIANKTGSPPHFRVGGTSGDRTTFHADQTTAIEYEKSGPGSQIPGKVTIGPSFYEAFDTFRELDTQYIYMVTFPLGLENALIQARYAVDAIQGDLEGLEIGNEVDLYVGQGVRPRSWTEKDYVREWKAIARPITEQVLENNSYGIDPDFIWQALGFAGPRPGAGFTLAEAFEEDGIDSDHNVKSVSVHHYMTRFTAATTRQARFMNHTNIVGNVNLLLRWKEYLDAHYQHLPLYIAEANSDSATDTRPVTYELQEVFGSALWKVDFLMFAMSVSIARYYVQQGTGFAFDSWQPVYIDGRAPAVLPPFYGDVFVADVVGTVPELQVANLDLGRDTMSAYAVYISGVLAKYVVTGLEDWNTTTSYPRPEETIALKVPEDVVFADVRYLTAPGANVVTNITWAGQSWDYSDNATGKVMVTGPKQGYRIGSQDGLVVIRLRASEAVLVTLERDTLVKQS